MTDSAKGEGYEEFGGGRFVPHAFVELRHAKDRAVEDLADEDDDVRNAAKDTLCWLFTIDSSRSSLAAKEAELGEARVILGDILKEWPRNHYSEMFREKIRAFLAGGAK